MPKITYLRDLSSEKSSDTKEHFSDPGLYF